MHGHSGVRDCIDDGFAPWKGWSCNSEICFHDRIAAGIKTGTLTTNKIAAISLRLLTRANEISLALLKEIRYVDPPRACEVNAQALMTAQRHISATCNMLKGRQYRARVTLKQVGGSSMLYSYYDITFRCYATLLFLNSFYIDFSMWLYGNDNKYEHITQLITLIVNTIDALQQCNLAAHPHEYMAPNSTELGWALRRAGQALRISMNSLQAVSIPKQYSACEVTASKIALLSNASMLVTTFKLLDIAARQAFATSMKHDVRVQYNHLRVIKNCCNVRALVLRSKANTFADLHYSDANLREVTACRMVEWALVVLCKEINSISCGMFDATGRDYWCYGTELSLNVSECMSALTLLRLAYTKARMQHSPTAKTLEQIYEMVQAAKSLCYSFESCKDVQVTELHSVLAYLELVRNDLTSIDSSQLLHKQWSATLLKQSMQAADSAFDICESELKSIGAQKRNSDHFSQVELQSVVEKLRAQFFRNNIHGQNTEVGNTSFARLVADSRASRGSERAGGGILR
ncbi:hypothetical protein PGW94_02210 [Candidatus Anaplasma sp. TIGMIC]|nr:hypothetical protein [Candidatus Anaplasma sp. TIGMIC]